MAAAPWKQDNAFFSENANALSSKVDAADLNGDKLIDVVFANGGGFDKGDDTSKLRQQAFIQDGGTMTDVSDSIFGVGEEYNGRAVKLRDVDNDGDNDILLGTTWSSQSQLFLNDGGGSFTNATDPNLPKGVLSVGDVEFGDVDQDGDLDIILSNWGSGDGSVAQTEGGITALWSQTDAPAMFNDPGTGMFEDVTNQMPQVNVRWSWELEFIDINNDWNLDIIVSAYAGDKASLFLFTNDGAGTFTDASAGNVVQGKYALDVETIDLNGDSFMDLVTLHDGVSGRNRVLLNDTKGSFSNINADKYWPPAINPASLDYSLGFYDHDSNKKVDWVVGALETVNLKSPDRLIYEKGGIYAQNITAFEQAPVSAGTYAIVLADFNSDHKLDVAMAQNEMAFAKKILLATAEIADDTTAPLIPNYEKLPAIQFPGNEVIRVRAHDNKSPLMLHDFRNVDGEQDGRPYLESWPDELPADLDKNPGAISDPGQWYGEYLWRVQFAVPDADVLWYRLCVIDAAKNKHCTIVDMTVIEGGSETDSDPSGGSVTGSESTTNTLSATESDSMSESNSESLTVTNSDSLTTPTDSNTNSMSNTNSESETVPTGTHSASESVTSLTATDTYSTLGSFDDGVSCGCRSGPGAMPLLWGVLALLRRRRGRPARAISR